MRAMRMAWLLLGLVSAQCIAEAGALHGDAAAPHAQQQHRQSPASARRQLHEAVAAAVPAAAVRPAGLGDALHGLSSIINGIEATLPSLDLLSIPGLPELKLGKAAALDPKKQKLQLLLSAASNSASSNAALLPPGTPSVASSVGFAFNGGIASAKSTSHAGKAGSAGPSAAESDATAIADRASLSLAVSRSDADNLVPAAGLGAAKASATSVADRSSISVSDAASLTVGLGGRSSSSQTTSNSAASNGGASYVGGTAVSSAGPGSSSLTVSTGSGAAQHKATALTRADSIALGALGGDATGSATADSRAAKLGAASSTSLMESFAFGGGSRSDAASTAQASALQAGASHVQDKAVAIGLDGATSATNTGSQGNGQILGLSVIDSVVRTVLTGRQQQSCAEAVNQAYSDVGTGPAVSLDTFILHLTQRADHQCVTSFKALLGKQQAAVAGNAPSVRDSAAIRSGGNLASALPAAGALPSFDGIKGGVLARTAPSLLRAAAVVDGLQQQLVSEPKHN